MAGQPGPESHCRRGSQRAGVRARPYRLLSQMAGRAHGSVVLPASRGRRRTDPLFSIFGADLFALGCGNQVALLVCRHRCQRANFAPMKGPASRLGHLSPRGNRASLSCYITKALDDTPPQGEKEKRPEDSMIIGPLTGGKLAFLNRCQHRYRSRP